MTDKTVIELYLSRGQYRWRMKSAKNGKIIGASTESYKRRIDALKNLNRVRYLGALCNDAELLKVGRVTV